MTAFCQITDHHIPDNMNSCINLRENLKFEGYELEPRNENLSSPCVYNFFIFIYLFTFVCVVALIPFEY